MNYLINVSTNFRNGQWSSVNNHVNRNYSHSSNTGINPNLSHFNQNLTQANANHLIYLHFKDYVARHDKKVKAQGHPKREYKSVKNYIKRTKGQPTSNVVIKFGTMDDKIKLEKEFGKYKVIKADNLGFKLYANQFNKRHLYFEMAEAETNIDEKGADHLHFNLVRLGHTKANKPSKSLNSALRCEYKTKNRILAMKKFHTDDDKFLITCMNYAYQKVISPNIKFKLHRTGQANHLSEKVFEKSETKKHKLDQASKLQIKRITKIKPRIKESKQEIKKDDTRPRNRIYKIIQEIRKAIRIAEAHYRKIIIRIKRKRQQQRRPEHHISM